MLLNEPVEFGFETDQWTTERVANLIEEEFRIHYHPDHLRRIPLNSLNFSLARSLKGIARERDVKKRMKKTVSKMCSQRLIKKDSRNKWNADFRG
jgi:transposase